MRKTVRIVLGIAVLCVIVGAVLFVIGAASVGWDFTKLGTEKYENNSYEITEEFADISINTDTADIVFLPSDDGKCKVECFEPEKAKHSAVISEGALTINVNDTRKWYDYISLGFTSPKITVYLPEGEYGSLVIEEKTGDIDITQNFKFKNIDVSVSTGDVKLGAMSAENINISGSTGDVCVENVSVGELNVSVSTGRVAVSGTTAMENIAIGTSTGRIAVSESSVTGDVKVEVSTGKIYLTDVTCNDLISMGDTGDISMKNVIATGKFSIKRDTGDVRFTDSDAAEIFVKTDTGDVGGSLLSEKVFITKTSTGKIDVPKSITGGVCEITTSTGDIKITVK